MEIATQTSLTGLSVLWDLNIDPAAGFFTIDVIKDELLHSDYSDEFDLEDKVRKKIDEDIIKEIQKQQKNKKAPAMTSIDLNILNEYSLDVTKIGKEVVCEPEPPTNQTQMGISNSNLSFVVKSSKRNKVRNTILVSESKNEVISTWGKTADLNNTFKQNDSEFNLQRTNLELCNKKVNSVPIKQLPKSSAIFSKRQEIPLVCKSPKIAKADSKATKILKSVKEPTKNKNESSLENNSHKLTHLNELENNSFKTPKKSEVDLKKSSNVENKSSKKRDWSPSMQKAFKSFCTTIKSSPVKKGSKLNDQRNTPKNKKLGIKKDSKAILKKNSTLVKKTIRKPKNKTKAPTKSLKNTSSLISSSNLKVNKNHDNINNDAESLGIEEITLSDNDDIVEIDSIDKGSLDRNNKSNILKQETLEKEFSIENIHRSQDHTSTDNKQHFKCSFCGYKSLFKGRLINHIMKHTGIKPFGCEKCDYKCGRKDTLNRHMHLRHSGDQKYKCTECELQFITKKQIDCHFLNYHHTKDSIDNIDNENINKTDKSNILNEETCKKVFNSEGINNSEENIGTDIKQNFKCSFCNYQAISKAKLVMHIRKHTGEKPFACKKCDYKAARNDALKVHMRLHLCERLSCPECDYTTNDKIDFQKHKITHRVENIFQCTTCQTTCKTQIAFDKHISSHSSTKQFICSECGNSYASKITLKQHMESEHEQGEVFACSMCNFTCSRKQILLKHILCHSGVKKFTCTDCDLQFITQEQIDRHLLTHPNEKPNKCSKCDYRCIDISSLKQHIKSHHTGELPYHCKDCGRLFSDKKKLRVHRNKKHKFEEKFYCSKCSYQCIKEEHLKDHMQTHLFTDTRTFACSMCDFLCSGVQSFKEHMKIHVGQELIRNESS